MAAINEGFKDAFTKSPMQLDVDTLQAAFDAVQAKQKEAAEAVMMKGIQFLMVRSFSSRLMQSLQRSPVGTPPPPPPTGFACMWPPGI